jgi:geranylgeranyl diphosphate synthase, type II
MKKNIELALEKYIQSLEPNPLKDAIEYALMAGGKRLRPLLMLAVVESYGFDPLPYVELAISLEMLHTYSLIHDDLPAMDDDTLRRGKPTLHLAFNEGLAILAGDALLTDSFYVIANSPNVDAEKRVEMIKVFAKKTGSFGMVLGQADDLSSEKKIVSFEDLHRMYQLKTANLLEASLMMGAIIASPSDVPTWEKIGHHLGILFQIQDDILEITTSVENLGKSKSDEVREKPTAVSILGLKDANKSLNEHIELMQLAIKKLTLKNNVFDVLIEKILKRVN